MIYCLSVSQDKLKLSKGGDFVLALTISQVLQSKIKYYSEHFKDLIGGRRKIVRSKFIMYFKISLRMLLDEHEEVHRQVHRICTLAELANAALIFALS